MCAEYFALRGLRRGPSLCTLEDFNGNCGARERVKAMFWIVEIK